MYFQYKCWFKYKLMGNRNKNWHTCSHTSALLTSLYFLCLCSLLYYCRLSFAKCCLAFVLFSIGFACLASCAWTSQQKRPRPFLIRSLMRNLPHLSRSMSRGQLKKRNRRGNRNKKMRRYRQKGGETDEGRARTWCVIEFVQSASMRGESCSIRGQEKAFRVLHVCHGGRHWHLSRNLWQHLQ